MNGWFSKHISRQTYESHGSYGKTNKSWVCLTKSNVEFSSLSSLSFFQFLGNEKSINKNYGGGGFNHPWIFLNVRQSKWIMSPVFGLKIQWNQFETTTRNKLKQPPIDDPYHFAPDLVSQGSLMSLYYQPKTMHYHTGNPPKLPIYMRIKFNPPQQKGVHVINNPSFLSFFSANSHHPNKPKHDHSHPSIIILPSTHLARFCCEAFVEMRKCQSSRYNSVRWKGHCERSARVGSLKLAAWGCWLGVEVLFHP